MKPTAELSHEHQAILRAIRILERMAERLETGRAVDPGHLAKAIDFLRVFADRCHHGKEESLLFPAMEKAGIPRQGGPIGVMLQEHATGRGYVAAMAAAAARLAKGDKAAAGPFVENARSYGALLTAHIHKEDRILFPMADARLTPAQQDELEAGFAEVEEKVFGRGKREEYIRLLEELESDYLG